ncbi:IgGFc-binding protein-like [Mercenaria mercenaria]|uniref:IgGFc-binding protein-like n=1 Tax=Mercenaria mercenaria TaxID=6596 RepID=UPI00234F2A69|nr:IgGFc-binding protein-like [Mercenaria mercenaria]
MCAMLILHGKMFTRMRVLLVFLYVLCASYGQTQPTGTFGRDFYIGILKTFIDNSIPEFSILITSNTSGTATIYIPHLGINTTRSFNQSLDYEVTGDTITKINATVERKGIHVTTDVDVTLVVLKHPRNTVEGFLSLPATMLSTEYVIASYDSHNDKRYLSNFLIVSAHDNTDIEIHENNSIYSVSMNHLDTYLFRGYNDLSGVVVRSNKPIAVFSGHESAQVPKPCFDGEYLVEQLLPVKHFAYEFIVPPIPLRSGYVVRVYSSVQNTTFTYSNATNSKTISLAKAGDFLEILSDNNPMYVLADKPVQVMMYATCLPHNNTARGDIFMTIVPSVTQFTNSYHFTVKALYGFTHYLAITTRTEFISGLRINDHAMGNLFHTYNVSHAYLTFNVNVYKMTGGVYHLQHEQGKTFGAIQCGFGSNFAYGYPLGINTSKDGGLTFWTGKDMSHLYQLIP